MAVANNKRTKITKLLFKNSLKELMEKKSINQITIREICENAELNRSTFYLHYTDQYALLREIESELMLETRDYLSRVDSSLDTLLLVCTFLEYVKEKSNIFRLLLCREENITFQTEFIYHNLEYLKNNISITCTQDMQKYVYAFLMQGCLSIIKEWILADFDVSSEQIADAIFKLSNSSLTTFR